jgi:hypothetical protein
MPRTRPTDRTDNRIDLEVSRADLLLSASKNRKLHYNSTSPIYEHTFVLTLCISRSTTQFSSSSNSSPSFTYSVLLFTHPLASFLGFQQLHASHISTNYADTNSILVLDSFGMVFGAYWRGSQGGGSLVGASLIAAGSRGFYCRTLRGVRRRLGLHGAVDTHPPHRPPLLPRASGLSRRELPRCLSR